MLTTAAWFLSTRLVKSGRPLERVGLADERRCRRRERGDDEVRGGAAARGGHDGDTHAVFAPSEVRVSCCDVVRATGRHGPSRPTPPGGTSDDGDAEGTGAARPPCKESASESGGGRERRPGLGGERPGEQTQRRQSVGERDGHEPAGAALRQRHPRRGRRCLPLGARRPPASSTSSAQSRRSGRPGGVNSARAAAVPVRAARAGGGVIELDDRPRRARHSDDPPGPPHSSSRTAFAIARTVAGGTSPTTVTNPPSRLSP